MLFISILSLPCFAQVGVGTLTPQSDLDVVGTVRLRKLAPSSELHRILVIDQQGNLATKNQRKGQFRITDIYYKTVELPIKTNPNEEDLGGTYSYTVDLGLALEIVIEPKSMVVVSLEYNIPCIVEMHDKDVYPSYMGLELSKSSLQLNLQKEVVQAGSRKYTVYDINADQDGDKIISIPVAGAAADVVENPSDKQVTVTYEVKGYVEIKAGSTNNYTMFFGGYHSEDPNFEGIGNGIYMVSVYEKTL